MSDATMLPSQTAGSEPESVDLAAVDRIVRETFQSRDDLVAVLRAIQDHYQYLPEAALRRVCALTGVPPAAVTGVATFYSQFRLRPAGRHTIRVCIGTACHVKGADAVYEAFRLHLGIRDAEDTDAARRFTVEKVACLGCCMLAPAVQIDDITYGFVTPGRVGEVIGDFLAGREAAAGAGSEAARGRPVRGEVRICLCSSCAAGGAQEVYREVQEQVRRLKLPATLRRVGCNGQSYRTPLVDIALRGGAEFHYGLVRPDDVRGILLRHFRPGGVLTRARAAAETVLERILTDESWEPVTRFALDVRQGPDAQFLGCQQRLVTEHAGQMDPGSLDDYLAHDGFAALRARIQSRRPEDVLHAVADSGLRGRGGAGFATGRKWELVRHAPGPGKWIICNGDEGDPGAFMDRMILESFPFRVLEGMALAAYAVGAEQGLLYIRAEYPLAVRRVREAIAACESRGYLGENLFGSGVNLRLHVVEGAGAFVCGEESALIAAVEGRRGMPRYRPPYPAEQGLHGQPTLVNNVETLALVPWICRNGPEAFARLGPPTGAGTKTFALAGKIRHGGLIEVPMGITLRRIVDEIGGGMADGLELKAVQVGGPSGGCVPAALCDTPVDYEDLLNIGAMMGSGGMVVLGSDDCMVDIARYFLAFTQYESCGKCTYCRVGTRRMLELLERLCAGEGQSGDVEKLVHLAEITREGSLCGLGRSAPNPVLSTLNYFRAEYDAHVQGRCPAGKCKALIRYRITDECIGCTRCAQRCPADAIAMRPYEKHDIDQTKCTRCDTCRLTCPVDAVRVE